ncbi:MAG TPA: hypothetical protein VGM39_20740 [Kofleriaceae bacterium]|jgi:hypothetical protein
MRAALVVCTFGAALLLPTAASADTTFETQAQGAKPVKALDDLVWTFAGNCSRNRDDVQTRQCKALEEKQMAAYKAQPLLIEGDATAFVVGAFDDKKKSAPTTVVGCIRCKPIKVDGEDWQLVTGPAKGGDPTMDGGTLHPPQLLDRAEQFPDLAALSSWSKATGTPRVQFIVSADAWHLFPAGGKTIVLPLVAWRVIAPCTGEILASSSPSQPIAPDKKACAAK